MSILNLALLTTPLIELIATETEGIFRLAGSEKRIKELKSAFDSPDRYGKGLDWTGYTVHDAANILRRYFNQLPEPIIPLNAYDDFRNPLRNHQAQAVGSIEAQSPSVGEFDPDAAIAQYQTLITSLPPLNRQLLLYILDLLAVFASKSDLNKMTTPNLAAIFQPGILSHPQHDMAPPEYRLSQDVLIFLIENQDSFLIGMQGTAADAETVRDVQAGTPTRAPATPTTPGRSKTIIGRSSSNASTRAESARKLGEVQRNPSGASKLSKRSENGPTPVVAGMSPSTSVHRSNTVPSRRGGSNAHSPRFATEKSSDPSTPVASSPPASLDTSKPKSESLQATPVAASPPTFPATPEVASDSPSEGTAAAAAIAATTAAVGAGAVSTVNRDAQTPKKESVASASPPSGGSEQSAERSVSQTPATSPGRFLDIFKQSPSTDADGRKPNKLQKRPPGPVSSLSSAQSSSHSLPKEGQEAAERSPVTPVTPTGATATSIEKTSEPSPTTLAPGQASGTGVQPVVSDPSRNLSATDNSLRPTVSPSHSYHSGTESDADMVGDDLPKDQTAPPEKGKRRHRWRFSRSQNKLESNPAPAPNATGGVLAPREQTMSRSTIGSDGARKSFQEPTPLTSSTTDPIATPKQGQTFSSSSTDPVFSDSEREKRSGPMSWIRDKMREHKDKDRARTPDRNRERSESRQGTSIPTEALPVRGKSFERQRTDSDASVPGPTSTSPALATSSPAAIAAAAAVPASVPETETLEDSAPPPVVPLSSDHNGTGHQTTT